MAEKLNILYHYFFPYKHNNYRAKALHVSSLFFYAAALLFIQSFSGIFRYLSPDILGYATDITVEKILDEVNSKRLENGLNPLVLSDALSSAANSKAEDMFAKNYWAHISPTGTTPWEFITKAGYQYTYAGENLAKDFDKSEEVVTAWMKSPTHKANILKKEYEEIGLAVVNGKLNGSETTLVVQEFGSRNRNVAYKKESTADIAKDTALTEPKAKNFQADIHIAGMKFIPGISQKQISFFVTEFLLFVLLIDGFYIWKNRILRISGHTLSHIIFLIALIGAMSFTGIGVIL